MRLLKGLLVLFLCFASVNQASFNSEYAKNSINFEYSMQWELKEKRNSIYLTHKQQIATINIFKKEMDPIVTANTLQEERSASLYDGWMKILSRASSETEIEKSNVEDSHINVFLKQQLNSQLRLTEYIIGEYYYIKNQYSYIVKVETAKENWAYIQDDLKAFLNSFWIGTGVRPEQIEKTDLMSNWTSPGNKNNNNFIDANPNIQKKLNLNWEFKLESGNNYASFPTVSESNNFYLLQNNTLSKLSYSNGKLAWSFKIDSPVNPHYLVYNSSLIFVMTIGASPKLIAYSSDTGEKIYSLDLDAEHSIAEFNNSYGYINDKGVIKAFKVFDGQLLWEYNANATTSTPLLVTEKRVLFQNKDTGEVQAISALNGNKIWSQRPSMLSKELSLSNSILYLPIKHSSGADKLFAIDINTGKTLWSFDKTILNFMFKNTISSSENVSIISGTINSLSKNKTNILLCVNNKTGKIEWEKILTEPIKRPIVTKSNLFALSKYTKSVIILDLLTGEKTPFKHSNLMTNDINIYKDYFIKIVIQNNKFIIQCFS